MDQITKDITDFLGIKSWIAAREIAEFLGNTKSKINSCLYAHEGTIFIRKGSSPPLWALKADESWQAKKPEYEELDLDIGILQKIGYKVGDNGLPAYQREEKLTRVMKRPLPKIHSKEYMAQWGEPMSSKRLYMLIRSLSAFQVSKPGKRYQQARKEWLNDIEFLKTNYKDLL